MEKNLTPLWPDDILQAPSLTAALTATGADFSVRVRFQGETEAIHADERLADAHYVREVDLLLDGVAVVWARSVCAADAHGWRNVLDCGQQSLGARLFGGEIAALRSPFRYVLTHLADCREAVWMRRSFFEYQGERLLLSETFLPALARFL